MFQSLFVFEQNVVQIALRCRYFRKSRKLAV